jgi:O-antigen ligase
MLVVGVMSQTRIGAQFIQRSTDEVVAAILQPSDDPTSEFRLIAWAEALMRFQQNPLLGEGYGVPFTFDIYNEDPRPHNTYLTILYKMGIVGFIPFALLVATFFSRLCRTLLIHRYNREALMLYVVLLGVVAQCLNGLFNFIVESPFMASIFWLSMGMGFRMVIMLQAGEHTTAPVAAA